MLILFNKTRIGEELLMKKILFVYTLLFSFSCLLLPSCASKQKPAAPSAAFQKKAPAVVIAPIVDSTNCDTSWSLSEELTTLIYKKVQKNQKFILPSYDTLENELSFSHNPFGNDLSWLKKSFPSHQFVVFLELVEHEMKGSAKNNLLSPRSMHLNMSIRVRIVDLRGKKPSLLLQELVQNSYFIPHTLTHVDYTHTSWGSKDYLSTPLYQAHSELLEEVAERIADYINP